MDTNYRKEFSFKIVLGVLSLLILTFCTSLGIIMFNVKIETIVMDINTSSIIN